MNTGVKLAVGQPGRVLGCTGSSCGVGREGETCLLIPFNSSCIRCLPAYKWNHSVRHLELIPGAIGTDLRCRASMGGRGFGHV